MSFLRFLLMFLPKIFSKSAAVSKINMHLMLLGFPVTLVMLCLVASLDRLDKQVMRRDFGEVDMAEVKIYFFSSPNPLLMHVTLN